MASRQANLGLLSKATLTLDDIDNIDRNNYIHSIGTVAVADRKYDSEKATFRQVIDEIQDDNPARITEPEKFKLIAAIPSLQRAFRDENPIRAKEIINEFKPIFLKIKKEKVRERLLGSAASRLRAPQGEFPPLRMTGKVLHEDAVRFYIWKEAATLIIHENTYTNAATLQMARNSVPENMKARLVSCCTPEDVFNMIAKTVPTRTYAIETCIQDLDADAYGMVSPSASHDFILEKIDRIQDTFRGLQALCKQFDITQRTGYTIAKSFGVAYGGTFSQQRSMVDQWLRLKMENESNFLRVSCEMWLEEIRGLVFTDKNLGSSKYLRITEQAENKLEKENNKLRRQLKEVRALNVSQRQPSPRRQDGRSDGKRVNFAPTAPATQPRGNLDRLRPALTCRYCDGDHRALDCDPIRNMRERNHKPPDDLCTYCLCKKRPGERHEINKVDGCHIGPASRNQKRQHNNDDLRRDQLCSKSKVSIYCCHHCFKDTSNGKKADTMPSPVYIMIQELLRQDPRHPPGIIRESLPHLITLPDTTGIKELIQLRLRHPRHPNKDSWRHALVLYDTGSQATTGPLDLTRFDHRQRQAVTHPIQTIGFHSVKEVRYEYVEVPVLHTLGGKTSGGREERQVTLPINCEGSNRTGLLKQLLSGERGADLQRTLPGGEALCNCSTPCNCRNIPLMIMGQDLARHHPVDVERQEIPRELNDQYPQALWKKSRITGGYIPWGNLQRSKPITVAINRYEYARLWSPLITHSGRAELAHALLKSIACKLLSREETGHMISQGPELVMNNLRTLFYGLKNLCLENSTFPKGLSGDFWESGESTFISWFGLTRRGCWPSHQANLPRLTDSVLEHWYKKLYPHQHGPCGMGTPWLQENPLGTPSRRAPDEPLWDPMDLLRPITAPYPKTAMEPPGPLRTGSLLHRSITPLTIKDHSRSVFRERCKNRCPQLMIGILDGTGIYQKETAAIACTSLRRHPMRRGEGEIIVLLPRGMYHQLTLREY